MYTRVQCVRKSFHITTNLSFKLHFKIYMNPIWILRVLYVSFLIKYFSFSLIDTSKVVKYLQMKKMIFFFFKRIICNVKKRTWFISAHSYGMWKDKSINVRAKIKYHLWWKLLFRWIYPCSDFDFHLSMRLLPHHLDVDETRTVLNTSRQRKSEFGWRWIDGCH